MTFVIAADLKVKFSICMQKGPHLQYKEDGTETSDRKAEVKPLHDHRPSGKC